MACKKIFRQLFQTKVLNPANDTETKLARVLSSLDLTLLGIGSTLGVGIYVLAGKVARESAGPAVIISFLIAAVASAFAGFCYAEFGARVPKAGSAYSYCYYTVGEFIAFLIGWNLIMEYIIGSASVTKAFSTYLDELTGHKISDPLKAGLPMNWNFLGEFPDFLAFGVVFLLAICLAFGFKGSSNFNNLCTGVNLCVVIFVIIAGAINAKPKNWSIPKDEIPPEYNGGEGGFAPFGISGIIKGAATCFYGFIGFDCIATTGEEAKTPKKSIPIAITSSLFVIFLTYFGVSAVLTLMWPYYSQNVNAPLTSIFDCIGWVTAKWIVSIGALFGLLPSLLGSLIPLPRIIYAMANDGLLYQRLGKISETYRSPVIGTISSGLFTGVMAMVFNLSQLIDMMSIGTLLAYTIVAACVLLLRYRKSDEDKSTDEFKDLKFSQILWMHLFNAKQFKTPSQFSSTLVTVAVFFYCVTVIGIMSCVVFLPNDLMKNTWSIVLLLVLIFLAVGMLFLIGLQPKSQKKLYFAVPFVPVVPAISIACNTYLILMLDLFTWIRFGIWIIIGIIIYFTYGINHSNLKSVVHSKDKERWQNTEPKKLRISTSPFSNLSRNLRNRSSETSLPFLERGRFSEGMKLWSSECQRKEKSTNSDSGKVESKVLSFFDLTTIGVASSLGIGISVLIGGIIKNETGPAVVLSIFLAGVTAFIGGLCSAEFGVQFLKIDSAYSYSYFWSRETVAFIYGWVLILVHVSGTASAARGIITFTDALSNYKISDFLRNTTSTGFSDVFPYFDFISLGIVAVITVFIAFGMKDSLVVKKLFTVCNVALIASIIIAGTFKADAKNWQVEEGSEGKSNGGFAPFGVLGVIKGAAIAFYGFIGLDTVCASGEEIQNRKKNLPLAVSVITLITLMAYVGIGVVLTLMLIYDKLNSHAAVPFAFQQAGWISFKWVVAAMSFFGFQTSIFGAIFPLPRIIHAMANDGLLFNFLSSGHARFKTPLMASMTGGLIAAGLAGIFSFQKLVNLTVIGALFINTILAINIILLRYSPKFEDHEKFSEPWKNLINKNEDISIKAVMQNYFNFKEKHPTNLTKKIIAGNIVLFCTFSTGVSVIFNVFHDSLVKCTTEAVIPASVLLSVMFFSIISITCQPKSQEFVPFKVPLIPFLPCLSIFLNIFLMVSFKSLTWILFSSWISVGILLHIFWRILKYIRGETNKNSLYEINKINAIKLNESIWKIKSDKKSFYEGAVNPVFSGNVEDQIKNSEIQKKNEKTSFGLKQAEIIQTAESFAEERTEPLKKEFELNFFCINNAEIVNTELEAEEKVYWECVAEIHTEEEGAQESVALEIVDNTYNFLSEASEDLLKQEDFKETFQETTSLEEEPFDEFLIAKNNDFKENDKEPLNLLTDVQEMNEKYNDHINLEKNRQESFKKELLRKVELRINNMNNKKTESNYEYSSENTQQIVLENGSKLFSENSLKESRVSNSLSGEKNQNTEEFLNLIVETFYEAHKSEMILIQNNTTAADMSDAKTAKSVPDERGKIKEFKEKLNQLLKNQINSNATMTKNSALQSGNVDNEAKNNRKNNDTLYNSIKTLNKSQIKGKLELLLAKGPPKRPSLETSFNLKIKHTNLNKDNESKKSKDENLNIQNSNASNGSDSEENFEKSSAILQKSLNEKTSFLNEINKELTKDVCC